MRVAVVLFYIVIFEGIVVGGGLVRSTEELPKESATVSSVLTYDLHDFHIIFSHLVSC